MSEEKEKNDQLGLALNGIATAKITIRDLMEGGAIPSNLDSPEKIATVIQHGKELGLDPVTSLGGIHVIKGRTVISAAIMGALLKRNGYEFVYTKDFDKSEGDNAITEVEIFWISESLGREMSAKQSISWNEMTLAGYTTKDNWSKYPKNMMRARALSTAIRAIAPEVLLGVYGDSEIVDAMPNSGKRVEFDEEGDVVIVDVEHEEVD